MPTSTAEEIILERFRLKSRAAGGPRAGFVLRRASVLYVQEQHPDMDLQSGIGQLVEKEILKTSESGDYLFLTAAGADLLSSP